MKRTAFIFLSLVIIFFGNAQTDTLNLLPVEVRSLRASAKAPFAKTTIEKKDLEKQNVGRDLPCLLSQTPSVVASSDAGNGIGYTGIRIRGSDATRINVTLNGIPFNDPESGGTFFVNLPDFVSSVSSIQIQRGAGSSSNGGGSFGGTINLSTHQKLDSAYLELANSYGSFHSLKNTIRFNTGLFGKHFTLEGRLSQIKSDGYIDRASSDLKSYYVSTGYVNNKTAVRFTTFSGKEKTYQAWYGVTQRDLTTNRRANSAGTEKEGEPYENETDNYRQHHYQLFFTQGLGKNFVFNTGLFLVRGKGYYEQYKADENYADYGMKPVLTATGTAYTTDLIRQLWLDNYFYGSIYSLNFKKEGTAVSLGGAVTAYDGKHFGEVIWAEKGLNQQTRWYRNKGEKSDANVYLKWEQSLWPNLQLYTDLQWRGVRHRIDGFRSNPTLVIDKRYEFFNPKVGLTFSKQGWIGFTSYSIANKEPNRDDFETGIQQLPKREQLHDMEAGIEKRGSNYRFATTAYYMRYNDQLILTGKINDVGAYTRTNFPKSYRRGVELEASLTPARWAEVGGNITVSRNRIKDFTEFIDDYDNGGQKKNFYNETPISFSPEITGNFILTIKPAQKTEVSFSGTYVGAQYLDNTGNDQRQLDGYYTQDVRFIQSLAFKRVKNVTIIGQVFNVFNKLYEPNGYSFSYYYGNELNTENFYYPMAGINWMIGLNIRF